MDDKLIYITMTYRIMFTIKLKIFFLKVSEIIRDRNKDSFLFYLDKASTTAAP